MKQGNRERGTAGLCFFFFEGWAARRPRLPCFVVVCYVVACGRLPHAKDIFAARLNSGTARPSPQPPHPQPPSSPPGRFQTWPRWCGHPLSVSSAPGMCRRIRTARRRALPSASGSLGEIAKMPSGLDATLQEVANAKSTQRAIPAPTLLWCSGQLQSSRWGAPTLASKLTKARLETTGQRGHPRRRVQPTLSLPLAPAVYGVRRIPVGLTEASQL